MDIDDRLVNGLVGTVKQIKQKNNEVSVVYVKFNDNNAGREAKQSDVTVRLHNWVPIKKDQALLGLCKRKTVIGMYSSQSKNCHWHVQFTKDRVSVSLKV